MADPRKEYLCWFPDWQDEPQSEPHKAYSFEHAAEKAAEKWCARDVEWQDHTVAVRLGHRVRQYRVEVRTEPVFTAQEKTDA